MEILDCDPFDEIFTHIDESGEVRHFNASAMARAIPVLLIEGKVSRVTVQMDRDFVDFILRQRGVESAKLSRMKEPYLSIPVIGVSMPDDTILTVDGHHRLVVLSSRGADTYDMYLFPAGEWASFLVQLPEDFSDRLAADTITAQGDATR